jgi:hypothetical protein
MEAEGEIDLLSLADGDKEDDGLIDVLALGLLLDDGLLLAEGDRDGEVDVTAYVFPLTVSQSVVEVL